MRPEQLRAGDLVEVRSATEILATLDDVGAFEGLLFMPEMVRYCGRRFVVDKRADKLCDTIKYTGSRRLPDAVILADLRCDGAQHEGCQAECRLLWKEAWLRRVTTDEQTASTSDREVATRHALVERLSALTKASAQLYRCQGTELYNATEHLRTLDPRPYMREYLNGNVSLGRFLRVMPRAIAVEAKYRLGLEQAQDDSNRSADTPAQADPPLGLQPGDWVQVKSEAEIRATLNSQGKHRGMWFDRPEMGAFCGGVFRVKKRVNRIIDDQTGKLIHMKNDCIMLEGVVCSGDRSRGRWFCPREIYPYWRECWLRRVPPPQQ